MAAMAAYGFPLKIIETYRPLKRQKVLYAQGRRTPGKIVTWTDKGWHCIKKDGKPKSRAIDFAFKHQARFPGRDFWNKNWPWERLRKIAAACDLKRTVAKDLGHFVDTQKESFKVAWSKSDKE